MTALSTTDDENERKTIDELVTRYENHPEFRDVYVEGEFDRRLVKWLCRQAGNAECTVYDIDGIDVPPDVLGKHDLPDGKKGRVVALAYELQTEIQDARQVTCIADKDSDPLLGLIHTSPLLLMTDYACQEMYFVNEAVIDKFLTLVIRSAPITPAELMDNVLSIVQEMHLLRTANLSLKWGMQWLPIA